MSLQRKVWSDLLRSPGGKEDNVERTCGGGARACQELSSYNAQVSSGKIDRVGERVLGARSKLCLYEELSRRFV